MNDTGSWYVANRYATSAKTTLNGTVTSTYVLEADTANTALLTIIGVYKNTAGATTKTLTQQLRVGSDGTFTRIKETSTSSTVKLTLTYQ